MSVEEYFVTVKLILMGLTFIALLLIFLLMIYREKEESHQPRNISVLKSILFKIPTSYGYMLG